MEHRRPSKSSPSEPLDVSGREGNERSNPLSPFNLHSSLSSLGLPTSASGSSVNSPPGLSARLPPNYLPPNLGVKSVGFWFILLNENRKSLTTYTIK